MMNSPAVSFLMASACALACGGPEKNDDEAMDTAFCAPAKGYEFGFAPLQDGGRVDDPYCFLCSSFLCWAEETASVVAYLVEDDDLGCVQGDGVPWSDGYSGPPDCWEEVHTLTPACPQLDMYEGLNYGAVLEKTTDRAAASDGEATAVYCTVEEESYRVTTVYHAVDDRTGDQLCASWGDLDIVADAWRCPDDR